MHLPSYEIIEKASDYSEYKFISSGPNGDIVKILSFKQIFVDSLYNLALSDQLPDGTLSDTHFSNNDDIRKIMATIVEAVIDYTNNFPERMIFFRAVMTKAGEYQFIKEQFQIIFLSCKKNSIFMEYAMMVTKKISFPVRSIPLFWWKENKYLILHHGKKGKTNQIP